MPSDLQPRTGDRKLVIEITGSSHIFMVGAFLLWLLLRVVLIISRLFNYALYIYGRFKSTARLLAIWRV